MAENKSNSLIGNIIILFLIICGVIFAPGFVFLSFFSSFIESCVLSWIITVIFCIILLLALIYITGRIVDKWIKRISFFTYFLICFFCSIHIISSSDSIETQKTALLLFPFIEKFADNVDEQESLNYERHIPNENSSDTLQSTPINEETQEKTVPREELSVSKDSSSLRYVIVDSDGYVNLRSKPTTNSSIIREITSGEKVTFLSKELTWLKVKYEDNIGYIHESRLQLVE